MGLFGISFEYNGNDHSEKKQQLMKLSEKELMVEILLELKKLNSSAEDIKYRI